MFDPKLQITCPQDVTLRRTCAAGLTSPGRDGLSTSHGRDTATRQTWTTRGPEEITQRQ